jgi:CO dehydrogenase nickel-insertion accessory protein CooC1
MKIIIEGKLGEGKSLMATQLQLFLASRGYNVRLAVDHNLPHQTPNENLAAMNSLHERIDEVVIEERQTTRN